MLKSINLSLSSACGADCIFCPTNRGQKIKQNIMPLKMVKKIFGQIVPEVVSVGENGDLFLNPEAIEIMRYLKSLEPTPKIVLSTNFQNFTEEKIKIIIEEGLLDEISCNIDSLNKDIYYQIKRLDLTNSMRNLLTFLKIRGNKNIPLSLNVIPYNDYIKAIRYNFNRLPVKISKVIKTRETFKDIEKKLKTLINPEIDIINRLGIRGWAEKEQVKKVNYKKYICKEISRIENEAFIAPDGTWYLCCWDSNTELVLGNIMKQSIKEIFYSDRRLKLIEMLKNREFEKIGGPCRTVNCCQRLKKSRLEIIMNYFKCFIYKIKKYE